MRIERHRSPVEGPLKCLKHTRSTGVTGCGRRYLEPTTSVATKVGTGRPSGHHRPPGDGGDSCRRRLGYEEPDAGQA